MHKIQSCDYPDECKQLVQKVKTEGNQTQLIFVIQLVKRTTEVRFLWPRKQKPQIVLPHFTLHHTVGALYLSQPISKPEKSNNQGTSSSLKSTFRIRIQRLTLHLTEHGKYKKVIRIREQKSRQTYRFRNLIWMLTVNFAVQRYKWPAAMWLSKIWSFTQWHKFSQESTHVSGQQTTWRVTQEST